MRVLVVGSRHFSDRAALFTALGDIQRGMDRFSVLVTSNLAGAERLAREWAEAQHLPLHLYPVGFNPAPRGRGLVRDTLVIEATTPELVVTFPVAELEQCRDSRDIARAAVIAKIPVITVLDGALTTYDGHVHPLQVRR